MPLNVRAIMKKNRTGNDSDSGRSGKAQRRGPAKSRAADSDAAAHADQPHTAGNGVDSATAPDGGPVHISSGATQDAQQSDHTAAANVGGNSTEDAPQIDHEADRIAELNAEIGELRNELLRKQADFENSRKRLIRDKEEAIKFANDSLIVELISVLDDFERAISSAEKGRDFATLHSGIELIEKQLLGTLERKWGLIRFDSTGKPFDPERHEALATERSPQHTEATVLEDYQKGYTLHGRVIRAARVRVATPASEPAGTAPSDGDDPNLQAGPDGAG